MNRFQSKVAIVTGGTSGIGFATAKALAAEGARVFISGRSRETGEQAVRAARDAGLTVEFAAADASDEGQVEQLFDGVARAAGPIDVVIASHGTLGVPAPTVEQRLEDFRRVLDVNITGTFLVARRALRDLRAGGSLVLVGSTVGHGVSFPGTSAYAASKAATVALAQTWALEAAQASVRVNALIPGGVDTPMFRSTMGATPESAAHVASLHALGRVGTPEELASAALFLSSEAASFITGSAFVVDGGMSVA